MTVTFGLATEDELLPGPELNVTATNAGDLLDLLGLPVDTECPPSGELAGEDFLGRVLTALALLDTATDDAHGTPEVVDGNHTYCARRPGYLHHRLTILHDIATAARAAGALVVWN